MCESIMKRTRIWVADVAHDFWSSLDVDLHTGALQSFDYHTHAAQGGNEFKGPNDSKLKEVSMLPKSGATISTTNVETKRASLPFRQREAHLQLGTAHCLAAARQSEQALPVCHL